MDLALKGTSSMYTPGARYSAMGCESLLKSFPIGYAQLRMLSSKQKVNKNIYHISFHIFHLSLILKIECLWVRNGSFAPALSMTNETCEMICGKSRLKSAN